MSSSVSPVKPLLTPLVALTQPACGGASLFAPLGNGRVFQLQNLHCVILLLPWPTKFLTELSSCTWPAFVSFTLRATSLTHSRTPHYSIYFCRASNVVRAFPPNATFPSPCLSLGNSRLSWQKHLTSFRVTNSCYGLPSHWPSSLSYVQVSLLHPPPLTQYTVTPQQQ